ncbi:hypothetical protein D1641_06430 [Colidextribacter sp. OB.20]|uniref:hypothetical protein n=1 Tax=Colidextribacter sp. OB.20 TaxID=2304568 RepID=UPI00136F9F18|nr:hypothetical protein [Colidextribacter sp. OB.20]NBI09652.1 hypothetical protein [Colidextribacter sp. OB.20]
MNEDKKKTGDWKMIIGGILLIIVLFAAIKLIFWGLGEAIPQSRLSGGQSVSASQSAPDTDAEAPSFCVHCGKALPESFQWGQFCPWCGEKIEQ